MDPMKQIEALLARAKAPMRRIVRAAQGTRVVWIDRVKEKLPQVEIVQRGGKWVARNYGTGFVHASHHRRRSLLRSLA
jgi:hypothetical protein